MRKSFSSMHKQRGFLNLPNDNMFKTIAVALSLCLVCSIIVSTAATVLKPQQVANKVLDKKRNILSVAGISDADKSVDELFEQIDTLVIDMQSGDVTDEVDAQSFDQRKASKDPEFRVQLTKEQDIAQIGGRSKFANVYMVRDAGQVRKIILPVRGYGLWSTMHGFIALESDAQTVSGVTFYEHAETPGLGGEIENPKWKQSWQGKRITDELGEPKLHVIKGQVSPDMADAQYKLDGLSGATLTSNGVTNLIKFWMGNDGFGPFLQRMRQQAASTTSNTL